MPWECKTVEKQRLEFVTKALETNNFSALCREYEITRKTGRKWVDRFKQGLPLTDMSRRPLCSPNKTPDDIEELIVSVRFDNPGWGDDKIKIFLENQGYKNIPCPRTITNILHKHQLISEEESLKRKPFKRFQKEHCNDMWQTDFKGEFLTADKNGVCCESEEMRLAAEYMMTYCKGDTLNQKMKSGFLYMAKNFPYHRTYDHPKKASDLPALAIDLFKNKKGNCFRYAAAFACTARIAGYRSRVVIGDVLGSPHGWVEVLVNGEWLICDPDAQLPGYKVPDYKPYMMKKHYWTLNPHVKCEVTIENGKAVWK